MGTLQQLSVLLNTADSCLPLAMLLTAASAYTADVYLSLSTLLMGWTLLMAVYPSECCRVLRVEGGICSCIALAGRWHTKSRNLMELSPAPHLKTFWVRWLAYKAWTLCLGNSVLWLWILLIFNAGNTESQNIASVSEVLVHRRSVFSLGSTCHILWNSLKVMTIFCIHLMPDDSILWHTVESGFWFSWFRASCRL